LENFLKITFEKKSDEFKKDIFDEKEKPWKRQIT